MAKRFREFKRINLNARSAKFIRESLVDKTFDDHYKKCPDSTTCCHHESRSLHVARVVEAGITVGKSRGRLDVPCPWYQPDPEDHIKTLEILVQRLRAFGKVAKNAGTRDACFRAADEIDVYAHRNAMEVIAETVIDVD